MIEPITLDGRKFSGVPQTVSSVQYDYIQAHLRLAGAIEILGDLDGVSRTTEKRSEDLLTQILLRGQKALILAGCLTEEGKVWSRAEADRNAVRFDAITDPEEIRAMTSRIVQFIIHFFELGEASSATSPKSLSRSATVPRTKNAARSTSGTSRK
jgi:hypothetical protein